MYNWYELAMHLDESMLESLQFCHRCLICLLKSPFDFRRRRGGGTLTCFDCLLFMNRRGWYDGCDGCDILRGLLEDGGDGRWEGDESSVTRVR
jgi:phage/plasmid primase-like uncharacterized protein